MSCVFKKTIKFSENLYIGTLDANKPTGIFSNFWNRVTEVCGGKVDRR